jgi:hypothetical protein
MAEGEPAGTADGGSADEGSAEEVEAYEAPEFARSTAPELRYVGAEMDPVMGPGKEPPGEGIDLAD